MRREMKIMTVVSLLVLLFLFVPSGADDILSTLTYILAFVLPFLVGFSFLHGGEADFKKCEFLTLGREGTLLFLPTVFPTVLAVIGISALTSLVMEVTTGAVNTTELGDSLLLALVLHALLPAVLEEGVFRYLPLRLFGRRAPLLCIAASSYFFALIHHSFFAFAYAAFAGAVFMLVDLACNSVIPSLVIHFVNNVLSVLWVFFAGNRAFEVIYFVAISVLALASIAVIAVFRKRYWAKLSQALSGGERYKPSPEPLILLACSVFIAVAELV